MLLECRLDVELHSRAGWWGVSNLSSFAALTNVVDHVLEEFSGNASAVTRVDVKEALDVVFSWPAGSCIRVLLVNSGGF